MTPTSGTQELPRFTEHPNNQKNYALESAEAGEPEPAVAEWLASCRSRLGVRPQILDVGCGRGSRVAWLLENGWDAYGVDVEERYVEAGRPYFESRGLGTNRLTVMKDGRYPFDAMAFPVVLSDQVVEHVQDLGAFASEIARVTASNGLGLHAFPSKFTPIEPHLRAPLVHWLPKESSARRLALQGALAVGWSVDYFADHPRRAEIYETFLNTETNYPFRRQVAETFRQAGLEANFREMSHRKMVRRGLGAAVAPVAAELHSLFRQTYVLTAKR